MSPMASQITGISIVYSTVCSGADQRKHQWSASLAFVRGIHQGQEGSPHKGPVTRKMFSFDGIIMGTQCLVICAGNAPVTRSVTRRFDVFFYLCLCNREAVDFRRHRSHNDVTAIQKRYSDRSYSLHRTSSYIQLGLFSKVVWHVMANVESSYFMRCKAIYWRTTKKRCNKRNIIGCHLRPRLA